MMEENWDFAGTDIHYMTHGLHPYPARMIPQIAKRLIERYSPSEAIVLDPFCGSGGVLVESILAGKESIGIDINPLACLLARVKTTPIDPEVLTDFWVEKRKAIENDLTNLRFKQMEIDIPDFSHLYRVLVQALHDQ